MDLLDTAEQGPADKTTKKARMVAGRTRATAVTTLPPKAGPAEAAVDEQEPEQDLAPVIPLPVFDAREEAKRWW